MDQELGLPLGSAELTGVKTSEICSKGLWKLLTDGDDYKSAARLIAINVTLRAELPRVMPVLAERSKPMTPEAMAAVLVRHAAMFHIPEHSPEGWRDLFGAYLDALAPLPAEALEAAFTRWNRCELYPKKPGLHAFFPKPAELYKLAEPTMLELNKAAYRAKRALEYAEKQPRAEPRYADRVGNKQKLIEMGIMDADGRVILPLGDAKPPPAPRPAGTPHQMAERLRAAADDKPPNEDEAI